MKTSSLLYRTIRETISDRRLVLVSNRGPVQFTENSTGGLAAKRGSGGLITALDSVLKTTKALWIAAAISDADRKIAAAGNLIGVPESDPSYWVKLVALDPEIFDLYYNQISNRFLWYLQHYLFDTLHQPVFDSEVKRAWHDGYVPANQKFADAIAEETKDTENPVILLQDYHLYLVAGFLRRQKPDATIFHFLHIPWCCPDYWRFLPAEFRTVILQSLLESDIVGFHTWRYVRNFLFCCQEFLGYRIDLRKHRVYVGERSVSVKAYPISISVEELVSCAGSQAVAAEEAVILNKSRKYKLITRVDRAELSKNLVRGFQAYELFLRQRPSWHGKVKFLAFAYPTREELKEYRDYRVEVEAKVAEINKEFGTDAWQPVELHIKDNYHRSIAALKHFDVLLTNPIYDGMNLVAKEAAVVNQNDGVIILSENAGAFEELRDSVLGVNPFDIDDTMLKIEQALTMSPLERGARAKRLRAIVTRNDILKWLTHQLRDIRNVRH